MRDSLTKALGQKEVISEAVGGSGKVTPYEFDENSPEMVAFRKGAHDFRMKKAEILRSQGNIDAANFQEEMAKSFL